MAARRITKSAIDWVAFAERVPEAEKHLFQAFKSKSDAYLRKAFELPENAPAIDWAGYRKKIVAPAIVDQFEKQYSALKVPYPTENVTPEINTQEKETEASVVEFVKTSNARIEKYKKELDRWEKMVPFDQMTMEELATEFPDFVIDAANRPTHWPHDGPDSHLPGAIKAQTE